jgi:microcin C transport system substrate-binding protein
MPTHGLNASGMPLRYGADFEAFAYANPRAPQGGVMRQAMMGSFDTFNTYVIKGRPVVAVHTNVHAQLLMSSLDEVLTGYAWVAQSVHMGEGDAWVDFVLREDATFHDGQPITTDDLLFTAEALRTHGRPFYRLVLTKVRLEAIDRHRIRVHLPSFRPRQAALEYGQLPILPRHWWKDRNFGNTTLEPPMGSGPYRVAAVDPGKRVVMERVRMPWSDRLPVMRGAYNFDRIEIIWTRDRTAQFEAFLSGDVDLYADANPRHWATAYDVPAVHEGRIRRLSQRNWFGLGMNGFMFNLRSPLFADRRVREALTLMYDFEWANRVLFHDGYVRSVSYFQNTPLAATDAPSARELELLRTLPPELAARVPIDSLPLPPVSDGSGQDRRHLERAVGLLNQAGWQLVDGRLRHETTGKAFDFAVMAQTQTQALQLGHWFKALRRLGIEGRLEVVDGSVYNERLRLRRFDVTQRFTMPPQWPGGEQQTAWHSTGGPRGTGDNLLGLQDPLIDALTDRVAAARDYETLTAWGRLLDRALRTQFLGVPGHHEAERKLAIWDRFAWPDRAPGLGYGLEYWWRRD